MKGALITLLLLATCVIKAQLYSGTDTIGSTTKSSNLYIKRLGGDSLSSCFVIVIKQRVKLHKHLYHSETVTILEGEGEMKLAEKVFVVKKGDIVFIPCNTPHTVTSIGTLPLKVLSVQSPYFDGTDRIFLE